MVGQAHRKRGKTGTPMAMQIDVHQAYQQWAQGSLGPFDAEDAYCAGYEMALRVKGEENRREDNAVVKNLRAISALKYLFG